MNFKNYDLKYFRSNLQKLALNSIKSSSNLEKNRPNKTVEFISIIVLRLFVWVWQEIQT